ncbi:hypothetical protein ACFX2G_041125 [Malus domestica]
MKSPKAPLTKILITPKLLLVYRAAMGERLKGKLIADGARKDICPLHFPRFRMTRNITTWFTRCFTFLSIPEGNGDVEI